MATKTQIEKWDMELKKLTSRFMSSMDTHLLSTPLKAVYQHLSSSIEQHEILQRQGVASKYVTLNIKKFESMRTYLLYRRWD